MKNLIYLLVFLSTPCFGQSLYDLMTRDGFMLGSIAYGLGGTENNSLWFCEEDTVCGIPILQYHNNFNSSIFSGPNFLALHIDDEKIYSVDWRDCKKNLLYDFSINVGDTIQSGIFEGYSLDSLSIVTLLDDTERLKYNLSLRHGSTGSQKTAEWIYGIGDIRKGFIPINALEVYSSFVCASEGENLLYDKNLFNLSCEDLICFQPKPSFNTTTNEAALTTVNNSPCGPSEYYWQFGDGVSSSNFQPAHTYNQPGCYEVSLSTFSDCSIDTLTQTKLVNICTNNAWIDNYSFPLNNINIVSLAKNIEIVYSKYRIFKTEDNALTWDTIPVPEPFFEGSMRDIDDIKFYDELNGILASSDFGGPQGEIKDILYYTDNGGLTWKPGYEARESPINITLGKNGNAWSVLNTNGKAVQTNDYGKSWTSIPKAVEGSSQFQFGFREFFYLNDTTLFCTVSFSFNDHHIAYSTDNGQTWESNKLPFPLSKAQFIDDQKAFVRSYNNELYETTDGCKTWNKVELPFQVSDFAMRNSKIGWIKNSSGALYYTTDKFKTLQVSHCEDSNISKIQILNDSVIAGIKSEKQGYFPSVFKETKVIFNEKLIGFKECTFSTSTSTLHNTQIDVYPNPASTSISINTDMPEFSIEVYNFNGQKMMKVENQKNIDISTFSNGTYFMTVSDKIGLRQHQGKFIVLK